MADLFTALQTATYQFTVMNGLGQPTDLIDGAPTTADSNPAVATSTVSKVDGQVGVYNLVVKGIAPDADQTTIEQTTVTIDADLTAGVKAITGSVSYTVQPDGRLAASSISFGPAVIADQTP